VADKEQFNNPLAMMAGLPDPEPVATEEKTRPRPKKGDFANPLNAVSMRDKAQAVGSSLVAGQYIRRTFTYTPGQLERIKEIARTLHIAETSVARWLLDEGLTQWEKGVRPEMEESQVKLEPKLKNW
jgi:hypothetical protein